MARNDRLVEFANGGSYVYISKFKEVMLLFHMKSIHVRSRTLFKNFHTKSNLGMIYCLTFNFRFSTADAICRVRVKVRVRIRS